MMIQKIVIRFYCIIFLLFSFKFKCCLFAILFIIICRFLAGLLYFVQSDYLFIKLWTLVMENKQEEQELVHLSVNCLITAVTLFQQVYIIIPFFIIIMRGFSKLLQFKCIHM